MDGSYEGLQSAAARLVDGREHTIEIFGQTLTRRDDVTERDKPGSIASLQAIDHSHARRLQMVEALPLKARADLKFKHHVQWNSLEARMIDVLTHAVVQHLEIRRRQP